MVFILSYCLMIPWINIGYIREYKDFKEKMRRITSENQLFMQLDSLTVIIINTFFNFIHRWFIYILVVIVKGSKPIVIETSVILFAVSLNDIFSNKSLERLKNSNLKDMLAVADVIYIIIFLGYLFIMT